MKQSVNYKSIVLGGITVFSLMFAFGTPANAISITYPNTIFAAVTCPTGESLQNDQRTCCPTGSTNSDSSCLFKKYINPLIQLLSAAVGVVVVIAMIVGGIEYASSGGDPSRTAAGKKHIMSALLGLLAYLLLYTLFQFLVPGGLLNGT